MSAIEGSSIATFCSRRASARSFSICLNSSNVVEPTMRSSPAVSSGLSSVARSIVPPDTAPAPTIECISSMKRIGFGSALRAPTTALKRSSKSPRNLRAGEQRAGVEREHLGVLQRTLDVVVEQPRGEPFGHRRLADARLADEHRVVLAPAAQHFDRPLQFLRASDERIEQALPRALRQVDAIRLQRVRRRPALRQVRLRRDPCAGTGAPRPPGGILRDPVRDVVQDVQPRDALAGEQLRRVALRLLEDRGEHVAGVRFVALARSGRA